MRGVLATAGTTRKSCRRQVSGERTDAFERSMRNKFLCRFRKNIGQSNGSTIAWSNQQPIVTVWQESEPGDSLEKVRQGIRLPDGLHVQRGTMMSVGRVKVEATPSWNRSASR